MARISNGRDPKQYAELITEDTPAIPPPDVTGTGALRPGYVSQNFKATEFGTDDPSKIEPSLVENLEALRKAAGDKPVTVHSGYRDPSKNAATPNAAKDSQHTHGTAADIHIGDMSVDEMYALAQTIPGFKDGGIGVYPNANPPYIHVDVRGQKARWGQKQVISDGKSKHVYTSVEDVLGKSDTQIAAEWYRTPADIEANAVELQQKEQQLVNEALVGVVSDPVTPEEQHQTTEHMVKTLVADPLQTGSYARGTIGKWLYGGTDADAAKLPDQLTPQEFLRDVLKIDYPDSVMKDLKFDKDVPALVNVMGWVSAASLEALRQAPLVVTDVATDPASYALGVAGMLQNPQKFTSHVWGKVKEWLGMQSPTKQGVDEAATAVATKPTHLPNAFAQFEEKRAKIREKEKEFFVGKVRPTHEVFKEANEKLENNQWSIDELSALGFNQALNDVDTAASVLSLTKEANMVQNLAIKGDTKAFMYGFFRLMEDTIINQGTKTAGGRAQRILQEDQAKAMKLYQKQLQKAFENRQLSPQELMQRVAKFDRPQDLIKLAHDSQRPGAMAMIAEMSVNGLFGVKTLVVNAASAPLMILHHGLNRQAAGLMAWNRPGMGNVPRSLRGSGVTSREGFDFLAGAAMGVGEGLRAFRKTWAAQDAITEGTKFDTFRQHAITGDNAAHAFGGIFKTPLAKWAMDWYGTMTRLTGRTLLATDEMAKATINRAEIRALSSRVARDEAVRLFPNDPTAALQHYDQVRKDVILNPQTYQDVMREGAKRGQRLTFTNPSDFKAVRDYSQFVSEHPGLRMVSPFVNVPVNIMQTSADMLPTTQAMMLTYDLVKHGLNTPDPVKRQMMMGKLAVSSGMGTMIGWAVLNGKLTGAGPADPAERKRMEAAGWRPYAVKIDDDGDGTTDRYVQYDRVAPWGMAVGYATDFYNALGWLDGQPDSEGNPHSAGWYANKFARDFSLSVIANLEDATFLSSAANFFDLVTAVGSRDEDRINRAMGQFAQQVTPFSGIAKDITRLNDPVKYEVRDWVDGIVALTPGGGTINLSPDHPMKPFYPGEAPRLAPSYSALGQPQYWDNGWGPGDQASWLADHVPEAYAEVAQMITNVVSPIRYTKQDKRLARIATILGENDVTVARPERKRGGFELPIIHYDALQRLVAGGVSAIPDEVKQQLSRTPVGSMLLRQDPGAQMTLVEQLEQELALPEWQHTLNRKNKQNVISSIMSGRRSWAFGVLLETDPTLRESYQAYQQLIETTGEPLESNERQRSLR